MLPEMIIESLCSTVGQKIEPSFAEYIKQQQTTNWMLFSDYVLKHSGRPNDVFAFSLVPGGACLQRLIADFGTVATKDFKHTQTVTERMLEFLVDERFFTFCFIVKPSRKLVRDIHALRQTMDETIAMMERWQDAGAHAEAISRFKAMRNRASSSSFNIRLIENIILATSFAAFLTYLVCKYVRVEKMGWFSDRDSITTAHQSIANYFWGINVSAYCQRRLNGWMGPSVLGLCGPTEGGPLWCDPQLRVPDHFAGTVSGWDIERETLLEGPKYLQVLMNAIAGRPNVALLKLHVNWHESGLKIGASRIECARLEAAS